MIRFVLGALVAPLLLVAAASQPDAPGIVSVFESGGISDQTLSAVEGLESPRVLAIDLGTLRMMGLSREGTPIQGFEPGFGVPLSTSAIDPAAARGFVDDSVLDALDSGAVVMSERSAALRGAAVGDVLVLEGWNGTEVPTRVSAILPDETLDWQELVMDRDTAAELGFERIGHLRLAGSDADARALRAELADLPVRVTGPGEQVDGTDFVLPSVLVKERFGEFSFRPTVGDSIEIDEAWVAANIVTVDIDPLGPFRCHRKTVPYIRSVIADLERSGLIAEIDSNDFQLAGGCWNARLIRGGDKGFALSRHAWGIAIDINPSTNRYHGETSLSAEFGEAFRRWGFAWGAGWLSPDGMHFEWTEPAFPEHDGCSPLSLVPSPIPGIDWRIVDRTDPCR